VAPCRIIEFVWISRQSKDCERLVSWVAVPTPDPPKNLVGPQLSRLRYQAGLSQTQFAAKCQRMGWDISRGIVAAIEGQVRCVTDAELVSLARTLDVPLEALLPDTSTRHLRRPPRRGSSE
jgi:hypothetical protein